MEEALILSGELTVRILNFVVARGPIWEREIPREKRGLPRAECHQQNFSFRYSKMIERSKCLVQRGR